MVTKNCVTQTRMWGCDDKGGYCISREGEGGGGGIIYCIEDGIWD